LTRSNDALPAARRSANLSSCKRAPYAEHGGSAPTTLDTLIDLIDAIGLELDIHIRRQPAKRNGTYSPLKVHSTV
jgi:hypothetical protein